MDCRMEIGRIRWCVVAVFWTIMLSGSSCADVESEPKGGRKSDASPLLVDLFIAGTHDSGAINGLAGCQDITLEEQLRRGIRAFDIRLVDRYDGSGKMDVYHGVVRYPLELTTNILPLFVSFLEAYPEEFVIVSLRKEDDSNGTPEHYASYEASLLRALSAPEVSDHVYRRPLTLKTTKRDLAGKIVIFSRNKFSEGVPLPQYDSFGHNKTARASLVWPGRGWAPFPLLVEDAYVVKDIIHKSDKKRAVREALDLATEQDCDELNIFFISGSAPATPLGVAKVMNPYTLDLLKGMETPPPGIYFVDFAGRKETKELIDYLHELNNRNGK